MRVTRRLTKSQLARIADDPCVSCEAGIEECEFCKYSERHLPEEVLFDDPVELSRTMDILLF